MRTALIPTRKGCWDYCSLTVALNSGNLSHAASGTWDNRKPNGSMATIAEKKEALRKAKDAKKKAEATAKDDSTSGLDQQEAKNDDNYEVGSGEFGAGGVPFSATSAFDKTTSNLGKSASSLNPENTSAILKESRPNDLDTTATSPIGSSGEKGAEGALAVAPVITPDAVLKAQEEMFGPSNLTNTATERLNNIVLQGREQSGKSRALSDARYPTTDLRPPSESDFRMPIIDTEPVAKDSPIFDEKSTMRQDFFKNLKSLSRRGKLTPEVYGRAKEELGKYEGVSGEAFKSTMAKSLIRPSNFTSAPPAESKEEAANNVAFQRAHGTGLGEREARQDPKYVVGDVGLGKARHLNEATRKSSQYRKAVRRLERAGKGAAAEKMALMGEMERMGEPVIDTDELRAQRAAMKLSAGAESKQQDEDDAADKERRDNLMSSLEQREAEHEAQVARDRKKAADEEERAARSREKAIALIKASLEKNKGTT